jgi:hypothetical protein
MTGIIVFFPISGYDILHFIHALHVMGKSEELTPFLGVISLAFACYGFKCIVQNLKSEVLK